MTKRCSLITLILSVSVMMQACASGNVPLDNNMHFSVQAASAVSKAGWSKKTVSGSDQSLYVESKIILDRSDIVKATAQKDALGKPMVIIQLSPMARLKIQAAAQNAHEQSLAVLVNDYIVSIIDGTHPVNGPSIGILNLPSMEVADYIAAHL